MTATSPELSLAGEESLAARAEGRPLVPDWLLLRTAQFESVRYRSMHREVQHDGKCAVGRHSRYQGP